MKRIHQNRRHIRQLAGIGPRHHHRPSCFTRGGNCPAQSRQGSTLLVVIALLGLLALMGIVAFTVSRQERENAEYFSEAAKEDRDSGLSLDEIFNFALDQLINGAGDDLPQSALWGRRHALMSNMFGRALGDNHPFNGEGVNLIADPFNTRVPAVDQNFDGMADPLLDLNGDGAVDESFLDFNDSLAANGGTAFRRNVAFNDPSNTNPPLPQPDVDYSYPGINSPFLAYIGEAISQTGELVPVVIPSFHRPQFLRDLTTGLPIADWYQNANTAKKVFRPHPSHVEANNPTFNRFASNAADLTSVQPNLTGLFPFAPLDAAGNPTAGEQGVWSLATPWAGVLPNLQLDVDNDNDGKREGVWIDLGFAPEEDPNGRTFVLLYSFTVLDADGLLNLNAHGNLPQPAQLDLAGNPFGGISISQSQQGLSVSEINPLWALNADPANAITPATLYDQHLQFFGHAPATFGEAANMEWLFAMKGRGELSAGSVTDLYPGRWGESTLLLSGLTALLGGNTMSGGLFPLPSISGVDDNADQNEGAATATQRAYGHPLAFDGIGNNVAAGTNGKSLMFGQVGLNRWPSYQNFPGNVHYNDTTDLEAGNQHAAILMPAVVNSTLIDDSMETILEPDFSQPTVDEIFGTNEMAVLHMSDTDINNTGAVGRVQTLFPSNFARAVDHPEAPAVRKRFTALSWDRKQFNFLRTMNEDLNGNGVLDAGEDANGNGVLDGFARAWEWTEDINGNGVLDATEDTNMNGMIDSGFPPVFGVVPKFADEDLNGNGILDASEPDDGNGLLDVDPFRPALRKLLEFTDGNTTQITPQMPFEINRLLVDGTPPQYRELTAHPGTTLANTPISMSLVTVPPAYPPTTTDEQEWFARRDRQLLARDIYVLLYTFGGGRDDLNYTTSNAVIDPMTGERQLHDESELRQMAQFAVNVVDAMDRDTNITHFVYDKDLSDGWNVDNDPYTNPEAVPDLNGDDRAVVMGVEGQQLTISEALMMASPEVGMMQQHNATGHDDSAQRHFSYIELRNASPFTASFNNEAWQIGVRYYDPDPNNPSPLAVKARWRIVSPRNGTLPGGTVYTIASTDTDTNRDELGDSDSVLRVDPTWVSGGPPMTYPTIAPPAGTVALQHPLTGLDLIRQLFLDNPMTPLNPSASFRVTDGDGNDTPANAGEFWTGLRDPISGMIDPVADVEVFIRRRTDLHRLTPTNFVDTNIQNQDNPWVEVDRMVVGAAKFFTLTTPSDTNIVAQLNALQSRERGEPFAAAGGADFQSEFPHVAGIFSNTLGTDNSNSPPGGFQIWQPHFDRNFATPGELLSVPLVGPDALTHSLARGTPPQMAGETLAAPVGTPTVAGAKILRPDYTETFGAKNDPLEMKLDNRWYRMFEFMEVASRSHKTLGNPISLSRLPGLLNVNMFRSPEVLAALFDDTDVITQTPADPLTHLPGADAADNRDWWEQFILSRDRVDPLTLLALPGMAHARPFRSFSNLAHTTNVGTGTFNIDETVENSLFRSLPDDSAIPLSGDRRRLFEVGTVAEHQGNQIDFYSRNRLLTKIMNNVTTRSNVYIVWLTAAKFEAGIDGATGAVKIGAPILDTNGNQEAVRGFFVLDRTQAEQAFDASSGTFLVDGLVRYRLNIDESF